MQQMDLCCVVLLLQGKGKVRDAPDGELLLQGENNVLEKESTQVIKQKFNTVAVDGMNAA